MNELNAEHVALVVGCMSEGKAKRFLASVEVLNESIRQGGWVSRGRDKSGAGFGLGFVERRYTWDSPLNNLGYCWSSGSAFEGEVPEAELAEIVAADKCRRPKPLTVEVLRAWIALCNHKGAATLDLDAARPPPRLTPIGLSPKVTKTLTECNLDLDLPSIRVADLDYYEEPAPPYADGRPRLTRSGEQVMVRIYYVKWTPGIKHDMSRFRSGCQACGKRIPSHRYVPIEATCKRNGLVSMLLGCDCARNIFGIKDVGINPDAAPPKG